MKKQKKPFLDMVAESDPEMAEIVGEMNRDEAAGTLRYAPSSHRECRDWRDAWPYSFRRGDLHPTDAIRLEDGKVSCVVWLGRHFNDKLVRVMERIAGRLGADRDLAELRLIGTTLREQALQRLKAFAPKATITQYSEEAPDANPRLSRMPIPQRPGRCCQTTAQVNSRVEPVSAGAPTHDECSRSVRRKEHDPEAVKVFRRGWRLGTQEFKHPMLEFIEGQLGKNHFERAVWVRV